MKRISILIFAVLLFAFNPIYAGAPPFSDGNIPPGCTSDGAGALTCTSFAGSGAALTGIIGSASDNTTIDSRIDQAMTGVYDYITVYAAEMSDNNTNPSSSPTQLFSTPNNVIVRNFDNGTSQTERFFVDPPADMSSATLKFRWKGFVSDATSATVGQKVDFQLACTCIADEGALGTAVGTAVDNNATASGTVVQYKQLIADGWSADVTVANWAAGLPIECRVTRVVSGLSSHYNKDFGLATVQLKIPRTLAN